MRLLRLVLAGLIGVLALSGCAGATTALYPVVQAGPPAVREAEQSATFESEPGTAITYDQELVRVGARAAVQSRSGGGTTTVRLALRGLEPGRHYGAHVHTGSCGPQPEDAGPHFQFAVDPVQPSVDPRFANPQNEIWLDVVTDETGAGSAESTVAWEFPENRRAGSVVVHAMPTSTEPGSAGTAGARAACVSVDF
jgi:Cu-Zn family superoxide dismutase